MYVITEDIRHGAYRSTRALATEHVDADALQSWGETSPYAWRGEHGERVVAELLASGESAVGWARYTLEHAESCDVCGQPAVGDEAGTMVNAAPPVTVCSDACAATLATYPCAICSAPVADEGDTCGDCSVDVDRCPACGDPIDYCQGHGVLGDPAGAAILESHDDGHHARCHPDGCDDAHRWTYGSAIRQCAECGEREAYWDDDDYPNNSCPARNA